MKATSKRREKTQTELLNYATGNLLRGLKRDILRKEGRVDRQKLRREGYSKRLITLLEGA